MSIRIMTTQFVVPLLSKQMFFPIGYRIGNKQCLLFNCPSLAQLVFTLIAFIVP